MKTPYENLEASMAGSLGYFAAVEALRPLRVPDDHWIPGSVHRAGETVVVDLLDEDPLQHSTQRARALIGVVEHGSVVVHDLLSGHRNRRMINVAASTQHYSGWALVLDRERELPRSAQLNEASVHIRGTGLLDWAGLDPVSTQIRRSQGLVSGATIRFAPTTPHTTPPYKGVVSVVDAFWGVGGGDSAPTVDVSLELKSIAGRPKPLHKLVEPLSRTQDLISLAQDRSVYGTSGRARHAGRRARGWLWDGRLMSTDSASPPRPNLFTLADIGGSAGLARWIQLYDRHPAAVAPVVRSVRNALVPDVQVLDLAAGIEKWVGAHRRTSGWANKKRFPNPASAVAAHTGKSFALTRQDPEAWGIEFWATYNKIKHDAGYRGDPGRLTLLANTGKWVLLSALLNRCSLNHHPSRIILGSALARRQWDELSRPTS